MIRHIKAPAVVPAQGTPPKTIEEYVGRVNTGSAEVSVARMKSPAGWSEPGQRADFDEYTVVLKGLLHVETDGGSPRDGMPAGGVPTGDSIDVAAGEAIIVGRGEWVRYSSPAEGGAEYISVCLPAFLPEAAHRDEE